MIATISIVFIVDGDLILLVAAVTVDFLEESTGAIVFRCWKGESVLLFMLSQYWYSTPLIRYDE